MSSGQIKYCDGTPATVGDAVLVANRSYSGTVTDIIGTTEVQRNWGLSEFGLMIETSYAGLMFHSLETILEEEIQLKKPA